MLNFWHCLPVRTKVENYMDLHGFGFTQDDAHIFCTPDQIAEEFKNGNRPYLYVLGFGVFGNFYRTSIPVRDFGRKLKNNMDAVAWEKSRKTHYHCGKRKRPQFCLEVVEVPFLPVPSWISW